jgi:hypothetical protein
MGGSHLHDSHSHSHGSLASGVMHMLGSTQHTKQMQNKDVDSNAAEGGNSRSRGQGRQRQQGLAQMLIAEANNEVARSQASAGTQQLGSGVSGSGGDGLQGPDSVTLAAGGGGHNGKGLPVVAPHRRPRNDHPSHFIGFRAPPPGSNAR